MNYESRLVSFRSHCLVITRKDLVNTEKISQLRDNCVVITIKRSRKPDFIFPLYILYNRGCKVISVDYNEFHALTTGKALDQTDNACTMIYMYIVIELDLKHTLE